ncbi:SigE family RNA polymerase sigma factor [Nocardioides limicola]|uniref:SigE family RNA polymerase sigma factor n=1 Tax=Nocardioides limicola TaxID=2803368 RepID=UPI00193BA995|nr:SigE family RNA polymerase sigma factor [Nocardioides sp. DJM-14]
MGRVLGADEVAQLYLTHRTRFVRLAVLLVDTTAEAEDVVQDAFAQLIGRRLRDPDAAVGYVRTAVVNRCRTLLRRRRTARSVAPPADVPFAGSDEAVLLAEEHREVLDALRQLPTRQREVLVLRYWADLSEAQIAETLGISPGTVKSTASRGLGALESLLDTEEVAR